MYQVVCDVGGIELRSSLMAIVSLAWLLFPVFIGIAHTNVTHQSSHINPHTPSSPTQGQRFRVHVKLHFHPAGDDTATKSTYEGGKPNLDGSKPLGLVVFETY